MLMRMFSSKFQNINLSLSWKLMFYRFIREYESAYINNKNADRFTSSQDFSLLHGITVENTAESF